MKIEFIKSAAKLEEYPFPYKPEVAFVGRSNAGKSSFLNALVDQKIAKVSQTPGKTRLLNFFNLEQRVYVVDCPGYGFATGNRQEVLSWQNMIETYLTTRETLKLVMVIMDIRRPWDEEEQLLQSWFEHHQTPWALVLNKTDKLSRSAMLQAEKKMRLSVGEDRDIFLVSSAKKTGFETLRSMLVKDWA